MYIAWKVALLSCACVKKFPIHSWNIAESAPGNKTAFSIFMFPSVSVPVLSRQSTSTCAKFSSEYKSCTSTFFLESVIIPAARLILMSRYSPFGSIPSKPAEVPTTTSYMACTNSRMPSGTIQRLVKRVTFRIEPTNSECMALVFLASFVNFAA